MKAALRAVPKDCYRIRREKVFRKRHGKTPAGCGRFSEHGVYDQSMEMF